MENIFIICKNTLVNYNYKIFNKQEWIKDDFDAVILGDDKRIKNGKPAPDIFILAANEIYLKPKNCIIFEDSIGGIKAGISAGAGIVIGIPDPHLRDKAEEIKYDENKTKLVLLDKIKDFDWSLISK